MSAFYQERRVPEAFPPGYLFRHTAPLVWPMVRSMLWTVAADVAPARGGLKATLQEVARESGTKAVEAAQRVYFDNPGLDTLTMREVSRLGSLVARLGRTYLWLRVSTGTDRDGTARRDLELIPRLGYDALMMTALAVGGSLGFYVGGQVHAELWWDSDRPDEYNLPPGHPVPAVRRLQPPRSLGDMAADIDDMYWADAYGACIKVTRVGHGKERRWLVSLPGTDHGEVRSQANPADYEANIQEELNIASAVRIGTVDVIHQAMRLEGIPRDQRVSEKVLICGHSQGGIIAVALASTDPKDLGFTVSGVVTLGAPARRWAIRPGVEMLAIEHDQDIVPSLDGTPRKEPDRRVILRRRLVRPRRGPLFYAHSSSTYTETLRRVERQEDIVAWGHAGRTVSALQEYLPRDGEPTRVTHHYIWQDLTEPTERGTWEEFLGIERPHWDPVTFGSEIEAPELPEPTTPQETLGRVVEVLGLGGGEAEAPSAADIAGDVDVVGAIAGEVTDEQA